MRLMLTSFGIAEEEADSSKTPSLFYRMPPVCMDTIVKNTFMPDYAALLLCEKVIFDESSFAYLKENPHRSYKRIADAMILLYNEGLIELVDFKNILKNNDSLLKKMLEHDFEILGQWIQPYNESLDIWMKFCRLIGDILFDEPYIRNTDLHGSSSYQRVIMQPEYSHSYLELMHESSHDIPPHPELVYIDSIQRGLNSSRNHRKSQYRSRLLQALQSYLSYVNANIVLSNELKVGFHDWADFLPFYRQKFLSVGKIKINGESQIAESKKLFEVSFPEFAINDISTLLKALQDKRVIDLRSMVEKAIKGEIEFDQEFAKSTLQEVLRVERKTARYRNIISYVTMPIGFLPWVGTLAQKATEVTVDTVLERKLKHKYRWFYLLSDLAQSRKSK